MTSKVTIYIFLLCVFSTIFSFSIKTDNELLDNTFLWQGFHHKWLRKIFFFLTPHRIGSLENRIKNQIFTSNYSEVEIDIQFTPGINGDWALPSTNFSLINQNNNLSNQKDNIDNFHYREKDILKTKFQRSTIKFNFNDSAEQTEFPHAESKIQQNFSIPKLGYKKPQCVLNGFQINMKCIDEKCNSNGVWPYKLYVDINQCFYNNSDSELLFCQLDFEINRGWTPAKGGGKAFNYKMSYSVEIEILTIYQNHNETLSDNLQLLNDHFILNSSIHSEAMSITREVNIQNIKDLVGESNFITGITAFGFELKKYKNYSDLGRYIGDIQFEIGNTRVNINNTKVFYDAKINLSSAKLTTIYSEVEYIMKTNTILLEKTSTITKDLQITGKVCKNDWTTLFFCRFKGMEDKQKDINIFKKERK